MKLPLFVALDIDDKEKALELAKSVASSVGGFKIGPRLVVRFGQGFVSELAELGPVFVDNKYYDIPSTMEHAIRASFEAGASFVTIHATCGLETMMHLRQVEEELNQLRSFKILAVTVLTSYTKETLPTNWISQEVSEHVLSLAQEVMDSGLTGIVCSAHEASLLRERFPKAYLVTPGIRFMNEGKGDQKRTMGPQEAIKSGASALVVGRPICKADDPVAAAKSYELAVR